MNKIGKGLKILGITTAVVGISGLWKSPTMLKTATINQEIKAYNYSPDNILDNVFIEDNTTILPFIYENSNQAITLDTIKSEFSKKGLTIKEVSTGNKIGTGTKIKINESSIVYTILVYGDVDGNGKVNLVDAQKIVLYKKDPVKNPIEGIYYKAADVSNKVSNNKPSKVDLIDAQRIYKFKSETGVKLVDVEPESLIEQDPTSIKEIILESIDDNDLTVDTGIRKKLIVKNYKGENLTINNMDVKITAPEGITVKKLDENYFQIPDEYKYQPVSNISVTTTLTQATEVSITITVKNKAQEFKLKVEDEPVLTNVKVGNGDKYPLYFEYPVDSGLEFKVDGDMLYNLLPIEFYNQRDKEMYMPKAKIQEVSSIEEMELLADYGAELFVLLPQANLKLTRNGKVIKNSTALSVKFYDENSVEMTGGGNVSKIAFSVRSNPNYEVILSSLEGKTIKFFDANQKLIYELPIEIKYEEIRRLIVDNSTTENLLEDSSGNYIAELGTEFTLGTINVPKNQGPFNKDTIKTRIFTADGNDADGVEIYYEENEDGSLTIKGRAVKEGFFGVHPTVNGNQYLCSTMAIRVITYPVVSDVILEKTIFQGGRGTTSKIDFISNLHPEGELIKLKDIKLEYDETKLKIRYQDVDGYPMGDDHYYTEVGYLIIESLTEDSDNIDINITLYEGQKNERKFTKTIEVYAPVIKVFEIPDTITIYENKANDNVVEKDGYYYTLLPIKAYADVEKTKPIVLYHNDIKRVFGNNIDGKVCYKIPMIDFKWNDEIFKNSAFNSGLFTKDLTYSSYIYNAIEYIGFTLDKEDDEFGYVDKSQLNNLEIEVTIPSTGEVKKIKVIYSE